MQVNPKARFSIVPSERRAGKREAQPDASAALLYLAGQEPVEVSIFMIDLGTFGLSSSLELPVADRLIDLQVERDGEIIINGQWILARSELQGDQFLTVFEHPLIDVVRQCGRATTPETFLKKSRYRVFKVDNQEDLVDVSTHLTELKDFPTPTYAKIFINDRILIGSFDFTSGRKALEVLEFQVPAEAHEIAQGTRVRVEYDHLGVHYIFTSTVDSYDEDFSILSLNTFTSLVALTARRFDRYTCDRPCQIMTNDRAYTGRLIQISPRGARAKIMDTEGLFPGSRVEMRTEAAKEILTGTVVHRDGESIGMKFADDSETRRGLHRLFVSVLPKSIVPREPTNYPLFFDLYVKVGYAPTAESDLARWQDETTTCWTFQDDLLPGNCTGGVDDSGAVVSSTGTLPFGERVAYAHSFCMVKTAEGAATFLDQAIHSLSVSELFPGVRYYAGSYAKSSRFTTRLHTIFKMHARPDRQVIIHSQQLFPGEEKSNVQDQPSLKIEELASPDWIPHNHPLQEVITLLSKPHQLFQDVHKVTLYLTYTGVNSEPDAIILKSDAWSRFTAAGMFGFTWIFALNEEVDLVALSISIRSHTAFSRYPLQVISFDGREVSFPYKGTDKVKPAFWTITDKDDFGPIMASLSRAVYAILRKYGEGGLSEYMRIS